MANGSKPPLKRQLIRRGQPPNVPVDIEATKRPPEYDPFGLYGVGAPRQVPGAQLHFPPWVYPPPGARYFYPTSNVTLGAGPLVQELPATVYQVQTNNVGVIREINLNVNNLLATSNITFRLLFNGAPVQGYDGMFVFPRAVASFSSTFDANSTMVFVPDGARISIQVQVVDAVAYQVGASYRGWYYSKAIAEQYGYAY